MIPKSLTIKGLYSYQTEQKIDFAELMQGNLFGIFGNVGAGKSSILEAIMLALYGEVERMGKSGRNYNILNLRSNDLFVLFDFEIEGKLYRSKVTGSRNSKKYSDVKIGPPSFYEKIGDDFKPLGIKTAESLIGLKSEDFKKTIIIPQGTFQDFLQLGDTDRARMMRELFGLERFELEPNVKFLQNQNDTTVQILRGQLTQIGEVQTSDIENKKLQLNGLQNIIQQLLIDIEQKRKAENDLKQLKNDFEIWQTTQKLNVELIAQEEHFSSLAQNIDDYETAVLSFKNLIENIQKATYDLNNTKNEIGKKNKAFSENQLLLQKLTETKQTLTPQYEQRENFKKQSEEVLKTITIKSSNAVIQENEEKLEKGNGLLIEKNNALEALKNDAENIEKQRVVFRLNQPNLSTLNAVKDWFSIFFNFQKELNRLEEEFKKVTEKLAGINQAKTVIIWKDLPILKIQLPNESKISDLIATVQAKISALKTSIEQFQHEQLHLKTAEKLETYASALSEGNPCPLCGATHHPSVMQIGKVRSSLKNLEAQLIQNKKDLKTFENIENQLITLNINFNNEMELRQNIHVKIEDEKAKITAHFQKFSWSPTFSPQNYAAVEQALQAASEFDNNIKKIENALHIIQKNKEKIEKTVEQYRTRINEIQIILTATQATINVLKAQVTDRNFEDWIIKTDSELKDLAERFDNQYITIEKEFQNLEKDLQKCQSEGQILRGGIEALVQTQKSIEATLTALNEELTSTLQTSHFQNLETVQRILATNLNVFVERQKLTEFKNQKLLISTRLTELTAKLQGKTYNSNEHNTLILDIQSLEKNILNQNQLVGELKRDIIDLSERLKQRLLIEKSLAECDIRAENLRVLRGLFQRSGFVNYASSVFLQSIIKAANERFTKLTKHQLQLKITENNGFIVRDMLNDGQFRDVRTLSGGQTFQAALSLALALSDHIQSRHSARQNFFFLDEGFGSLDRESLQIVFDTLKALRKENRIVGIISHVEDMRLEIERYLLVSLKEDIGSQIEMVIG